MLLEGRRTLASTTLTFRRDGLSLLIEIEHEFQHGVVISACLKIARELLVLHTFDCFMIGSRKIGLKTSGSLLVIGKHAVSCRYVVLLIRDDRKY